MTDVSLIYKQRFEETGLQRRSRVWKVLCKYYFNRRIPAGATVLDLACGYGEFINNIEAERKFAVDLNPDSALHLSPGIQFSRLAGRDVRSIGPGTIDVVFTSNFLEHLRDKTECDEVLSAVRDVLKPGGRFIVMGPNIRYAYREYWDYYDHILPLSDLSLVEGLRIAGFKIVESIPRFLPFSMNSRLPSHDILIRGYLAFPALWRLLGKQFLVTASNG